MPVIKYRRKRISGIIESWAVQNGYSVVSCKELRVLDFGPYNYFMKTLGDAVCEVKIKTGSGIEKKAWLKLTGIFFPMVKKTVECKWNVIPDVKIKRS